MSTPTTEVTVTFTKHQARQVYRAIQALGWDAANLDISATSEAYMALALAMSAAGDDGFSDVAAHVYPHKVRAELAEALGLPFSGTCDRCDEFAHSLWVWEDEIGAVACAGCILDDMDSAPGVSAR